MRRSLLAAVVLLVATSAWAVPAIDQENVVNQSVGSRIIYAGNSPGQSFTAGSDGLLTQVDVRLSRDEGDIGEMWLDIWPMVAGAPAGAIPLFSTPIDTNDVPVGFFDFVSVDVSAGMIGVNYGDQLTIAVNGSAGLDDPNSNWDRGFTDYLGGEKFDRTGVWESNSPTFDYGFRTWVDPDVIPAGLVVLPDGDYNGDAHVNAADYTVWRDSFGQLGTQMPADGDRDGEIDQDDYDVWSSAYGLTPDMAVANGGFDTGDLSDWDVVVGPNTDVSFGFPRVESFDVDGDGPASDAMRVRLGRLDTSQFGGSVTIQQKLLLEEGDYEFSADIASQSLEAFGNTGPGNYELALDGVIIDQVFLEGTLIEAIEVIRDSLSATVEGVTAGYHTLSLTIARGGTNSREIYQFIDNVQMTKLGAPSQAVPEPGGFMLAAVAAGAVLCGRLPRSQKRRRAAPSMDV